MTLFSLGPLYLGLSKTTRWDFWVTSAALHIHIGMLRLEWDRRRWHNGPTQKTAHRSRDRETVKSH